MARSVKIRTSYDSDARFMLRLKEAVELDSRDPTFQREVSRLLQSLSGLLITGPKSIS